MLDKVVDRSKFISHAGEASQLRSASWGGCLELPPYALSRRVECLESQSITTRSEESQVWSRHSWDASPNEGRRVFDVVVDSCETSALVTRVLRATAQYSICGWDGVSIPSTDHVPVKTSIIKALERSNESAAAGLKREVGVCQSYGLQGSRI